MPTTIKSIDRPKGRVIVNLSNGQGWEYGSWDDFVEHVKSRLNAYDADEFSILFSLMRWIEKHPDGADGSKDSELITKPMAIDFKAATDADIVTAAKVDAVDTREVVANG